MDYEQIINSKTKAVFHDTPPLQAVHPRTININVKEIGEKEQIQNAMMLQIQTPLTITQAPVRFSISESTFNFTYLLLPLLQANFGPFVIVSKNVFLKY